MNRETELFVIERLKEYKHFLVFELKLKGFIDNAYADGFDEAAVEALKKFKQLFPEIK